MGTGFDVNLGLQEQGIIPRAVHQLFEGIQSRRLRAQQAGVQAPEFKVSAQFLEVGGITVVSPNLVSHDVPSTFLLSRVHVCVCWMSVHINWNQMGLNRRGKGMSLVSHKREVAA